MSGPASIALVLAAAALTSCDMFTGPDLGVPRFSCVSDAPGVDLADSLRTWSKSRMYLQDPWISTARTQPGGFGGISGGLPEPVLEFVDTAAARAALPAILQHLGFSGSPFTNPALQQVKWNYAQLYDWRIIANSVLPSPGGDFLFLGTDTPSNRLIAYVTTEAERTRVINDLNAAKIPCNLVWVTIYVSGDPVTP